LVSKLLRLSVYSTIQDGHIATSRMTAYDLVFV